MDDQKYERIIDILFDLKDDISTIQQEVTENTLTLEEHQRRSIALEQLVAIEKQRVDALVKKENMLNGFYKISLGILGMAGTVTAIVVAIHNLR
jgi:hypothetical protein